MSFGVFMKVPKARKLKSGTWFIQLRLGGKSFSFTGSTKSECTLKASAFKSDYLLGTRLPFCSRSLDSLFDSYISEKESVLSSSTVRGYVTAASYFGKYLDLPFDSILDWQAVVNYISSTHSPKTVKNTWGFASAAFRAAGLSVPSVSLPSVMPNVRPWLDDDEISIFVNSIYGKPIEAAALLALHSLRRSEILGLDKSDIDRKNKTIYVHSSLVFDKDQNLVLKNKTKNSSSTRVIPVMIPRLLDCIDFDTPGKVVTYHPNSLYNAINKECRLAGLPEVGVHGLRHSFASLCRHFDVPPQLTMRYGGWSDYSTIQRIYEHISAKDELKRSNAISDFFASVYSSQNAN